MRVLVCGSGVLSPDLHEVARTVGRTLIERTPHTLLLGGLAGTPPERSTDEMVAEGAREALQKLRKTADTRAVTMLPDRSDSSARFVLGTSRVVTESDPAMRRTVMVASADLVISVAGRHGTTLILDDAQRLRKPILPLAFTGEASENAWKYHRRAILRSFVLTGDEIDFIERGAPDAPAYLERLIARANPDRAAGRQELRVVVASPGDVKGERECVYRVLDELNYGVAPLLGLNLAGVGWDTHAYPAFHLDGPQAVVDQILRIEQADLVIGIFWHRFGTPTRDARSGTEHEIRNALRASVDQGKPHLMLYFSCRPYAAKTSGETEQWTKVLSFREELQKEGLLGEFRNVTDFERRLRRHLTTYLRANYS
jgi:uncharacterized protein (TIGR00725 family)